jgi:hypothetical protein
MFWYNRRRHDGLAITRRQQQGPGGQPLQVHDTAFLKHDFILSLIPCSVAGFLIQYPGSKRFLILIKNQVFLTQNIASEYSEI